MDLAFIDVACSPGNTSSDAGYVSAAMRSRKLWLMILTSCVLAVLDSNFEVALYKPEKNGLTGQWKKVILRNDLRIVTLMPCRLLIFWTSWKKSQRKLRTIRRVQTYSLPYTNKYLVSHNHNTFHGFSFVIAGISWSLTPDFGFPHALNTNGSILAVGTCAGTVQLLKYTHRFWPCFS